MSGLATTLRPRITVARTRHFVSIDVEQFDQFPFMDGDYLALDGIRPEDQVLNTVDRQCHIKLGRAAVVRFPEIMRFFDYEGYRIPRYLAALRDIDVESLALESKRQARQCIALCPATNEDLTIVELGSGIGCLALELAKTLPETTAYIGVEMQRESAVWCMRHIYPTYPNCGFHHLDVQHPTLNPLGSYSLLGWTLPMAGRSADLVVVQSAFLFGGVRKMAHGLSEIGRVLKPDGVCLLDFSRRPRVAGMGRRDGREAERGGAAGRQDATANPVRVMRSMLADAGLRQRGRLLRVVSSEDRSPGQVDGVRDTAAPADRLATMTTTPDLAAYQGGQARDAKLERQLATSRLAGRSAPRFRPQALDRHQTDMIRDFNRFLYDLTDASHLRTYCTAWLGYEMFKWPTDLWSYQELVSRCRPDVIIETGTYRGGSALFLASMCDLLDHGEVVSIDVSTSWIDLRPSHPRITYINGSSTEEGVFRTVEQIVRGRNVLVILDSDHRRDHVYAELGLYSKLIHPDMYLIVEDTSVNGHPSFEEFGPGPWEAVDEFLSRSPDFEVDPIYESLFVSQNPRGYLRRVEPSSVDVPVDAA